MLIPLLCKAPLQLSPVADLPLVQKERRRGWCSPWPQGMAAGSVGDGEPRWQSAASDVRSS